MARENHETLGPRTLTNAAPPVFLTRDAPPMVGEKHGLLFLRDKYDFIRVYPHARLALDAHASAGDAVNRLGRERVGADLGTRFFVRDARLGLGGELMQRVGFDVGLDLVANPAIDGARADGTRTKVALSNAWAAFLIGREIALTAGYFPGPFSLENRSAPSDLPQLERNLATRGLIMPGNGKVLGVAFGAEDEFWSSVWRLDAGVFGAETLEPGDFSRNFQVMTRMTLQPLATRLDRDRRKVQFGVSFRYGKRTRRDTREPLAAITTGQGFALFRPSIADGESRLLIIPSSNHYAIGGEVYVPLESFVLRAEAYWASTRTHEAGSLDLDAPTVRRGVFEGLGWYAELSFWPLQQWLPIEGGAPPLGEQPKIEHLEVAPLPPLVDHYGVELAAIIAGIHAAYRGNDRAGVAALDRPASDVTALQIGAAASYWHTARVRFSLAWNMYLTPGNGNLAVVPANVGPLAARRDTHTLHELGGRILVAF